MYTHRIDIPKAAKDTTMATEIQYQVFRSFYDEESTRYSSLAARAQLYFSVVSLYVGAIAFKFDEIRKLAETFRVPALLLLIAGVCMLASLLMTILAVAIRNYEGLCDPVEVIEGFGDTPPTDSDFLDDRIAEAAVATNLNFKQNNRTANFLSWAVFLLFIGVALYLGIFIVAASHA
jgi:hypothetical protein